jgi:uncharacterized protein
MNAAIVSFRHPVPSEESAPASERVIAGTPRQTIANHFTDSTRQFFAGRWSSTRGKWHVRYTENELCHITKGRVRIEASSGTVETFGPGDTFVVPAGFEGTWEVLEDCSKVYAIFEGAQR